MPCSCRLSAVGPSLFRDALSASAHECFAPSQRLTASKPGCIKKVMLQSGTRYHSIGQAPHDRLTFAVDPSRVSTLTRPPTSTLTFTSFPSPTTEPLDRIASISATLRVCERRPVCRPQGGFSQKADCANEPFAREHDIHTVTPSSDSSTSSSCASVRRWRARDAGHPRHISAAQLTQYRAGRCTSEDAYLPSWPIQQFRCPRKGLFSLLARHVSSVALACTFGTN
ncbi:hypothetical protein B0H65DRAFT_239759 [Neurospora tetraspora]|uniref:Uncharacterized protein n=1 Tax=Neurospora tetraspora TaxID=94610 RepID=A0AAE0JDX5_9PEZI|nr:hypothetical protein B0H65DRAFT_239759 [Neurospora tetraspora]